MKPTRQTIRFFTLPSAFALTMLGVAPAQAQLDLSWNATDNGGQTFGAGDEFRLGATAGQFDAGAGTGGEFALRGGFWGPPKPIRLIRNGATGDGRLELRVDVYGTFQLVGGSTDNYDVYDPPGATPAASPTFSSALYLFVSPGSRELLTHSYNWQTYWGFDADTSLRRRVLRCCDLSDANLDGVDDTVDGSFAVSGTGVSLTVALTQSVSTPDSNGAAYLRQEYRVTNTGGAATTLDLVRVYDADLPWTGTPAYTDDWVGAGNSIGVWYVFMQEPNAPATAVTLSSQSPPDAYFAGKRGVDPDGAGGSPPFGYGSDTTLWDNYGVPTAWLNYVAGVGYNTPGVSGSSPPGSLDPRDGFVGLRFLLSLLPGETKTLTLLHSYGTTRPLVGVPGDLNCDGVVDFDDISPFVLALSDPAAYAAAYPDCLLANADLNRDGVVDFTDINGFVAALSGG